MAQNQLLFILKKWFFLIFLVCSVARAESMDLKKNIESDLDFAIRIARYSRTEAMSAMKEKWHELQKMERLSGRGGEFRTGSIEGIEEEVELKIFVSSSMGKSLLKAYAEQARNWGASLIFRGLPEGSWRKLSDLVYEIEGEVGEGSRGVSFQINDVEFEEYGISEVPSFVLVRRNLFEDISGEIGNRGVFDKVRGNIGVRRALEEISFKGDLAKEALRLLESVKDRKR